MEANFGHLKDVSLRMNNLMGVFFRFLFQIKSNLIPGI